jgi:seryl-tRNA synthetase
MHDIRSIREAPDAFDTSLARLGVEPVAAQVLALDETRRARILAAERTLAERKAASKQIGAAKAAGDGG